MRIASLHLEAYGHFTDRRLAFDPTARVHVVHGANEAGKTSALTALGDVLFGFPERTPHKFLHEPSKLRVGAVLRGHDGREIMVRRRKARAGSLVDAADKPLGDDLLDAVLMGVTRHDFDAEFGLTATALRKGGDALIRAGGRLAETLAAGSAGLSDLLRVSKTLGEEAQLLFDPGRRVASRAFYKALDGHEAATRAAHAAVVRPEEWKTAQAALDAAADVHKALRQEHAALGKEHALLERTRRTRFTLVALARARDDLAAFDLPATDDAALARWRDALVTRDERDRRLAELDAQDEAAAIRMAALAVDAALLAAGPAIDKLRERVGAVLKAAEDRPRRVEAHRAAFDELQDAARRLGIASAEQLLAAVPDDAAVARAHQAIGEGKRLRERLAEAAESLHRAIDAEARLAAEAPSETVDPEPLRRRLAVFADVPRDADRLREFAADIAKDRNSLSRRVAAFEPPVASLDALMALRLPDAPAVEGMGREHEALVARARDGEAALSAAESRQEKARADLARLAARGVVATRQDFVAARAARDAAVVRLKDEVDVGRRAEGLQAVNTAIVAADEIADHLIAHGADAARRETAEQAEAEARGDAERARNALDDIRRERTTWTEAWTRLWQASGVAARDLPAMLRWRQLAADAREAARAIAERGDDLAALEARLAAHGEALRGFATGLGIEAASLPPELVYRGCAGTLDAMTDAWVAARTRDADRRHAGTQVRDANGRLASAEHADAAWRAAWPAVLAAIRAPAHYDFVEAEAALAAWRAVPAYRIAYEREGRSVEGIDRDLDAFRSDVGHSAEAVAPDLAGASPNDALAALGARLLAAREAARERAVLEDARLQRDGQRRPLVAARDGCAALLEEARRALALPEGSDLAGALTRLAERKVLQDELARLAASLRESSDGRSEAELHLEQAALDLPMLDARIEALNRRMRELVDQDISAAAARENEAARRVGELEKGRDAHGAAQLKVEAAQELVDVAMRWLVGAGAQRLATLAIERHRAAVQDPLIARASALFAILTDNAFGRLATAYDEDGKPELVACRANGTTVAIGGLSEGTCDQLFLALRLALLERRATTGLPFVGDDLLASFDEARTASALDCLADFGERRQVILFTHHAHVADIALTRSNRIEVLRLA